MRFSRKQLAASALPVAALITALHLAPSDTFASETFVSDQGHTEVLFGWSHAGVSTQNGEFTSAEAVLSLDSEDVSKSSVEVTIAANSLSTGFGALDDHLKTADFFDAETYPEITFKSTSIEQTGDNTGKVSGDLTMHGTTKPITLDVTLTHQGEHPVAEFIDYYKGDWVAFSATTTINHLEFGVGAFPAGPTDEITITVNTEMRKQ